MSRAFWEMLPLPTSQSAVSASTRLHALDGIRGWAALSVVCFHMSWETFGKFMPVYRNPFTAPFIDGALAVSIFFVLSGEALSVGFFAGRGRKSIIDLGIKRYPRLVIPTLATSIIIFLLSYNKIVFNQQAGQIVNRADWLGMFLNGEVSIKRVILFSFYDVFSNSNPFDNLNPFLWTMRIELIGSFLVFFILFLPQGRYWFVFLASSILLLLCAQRSYSQLACFLSGIAFARLRLGGTFAVMSDHRWTNLVTYVLLLSVMAADGFFHSHDMLSSRCSFFAIMIVFCVSVNKNMHCFMESSISQALGRLSFPIFLMQFPVIVTFTSASIVAAASVNCLAILSPIIIFTSVVITIVCAYFFNPIELFTKLVCRQVSKTVFYALKLSRVSPL